MRQDRNISLRLREMLTHDKVNIKEGFLTALNNDLNRLLCDYFDLKEPASAMIGLSESGEYEVKINACATRIKQFETTLDIKRY
ncbi:MAG: hypothetical protein NC037_00480 [Bacteroides sp.]|nr:hypothetical protein [Bacillota bacterium]MCM1393588.1 hypothetical protein [[Eubacterium] siraeum]MCM1454993.1 hypothetical protein [Bacteroides sp.]